MAACLEEFEKLLGTIGLAIQASDSAEQQPQQQYQVIQPMTAEVTRQVKSICDTFGK